ELLARRDDDAGATSYLDRALDIFHKRAGARSPYLAYAYTLRGRLLTRAGKAADAVPLLEQAQAIRAATPTAPELIAETQLALGDALWRSRRDARARALVEDAEKGFAAGEDADGRKAARAWLDAH